MRIIPKDWGEFQHYKDRDPPWIKLHKKLLDNYEFYTMPAESRALAPMLWLLASECKDGIIDWPEEKLCFRLHLTADALRSALASLVTAGFFAVEHGASKPLARRKHHARPSTEVEEQVETQVQAEEDSCAAPSALAPPVIALPTNRFKACGEEVGFSQVQIDDYAQTYPAVDVPQQFREMRRWLVDNPERRKTARGMGKFVNGWLGKEQDKGSGNGQAGRKPTAHENFALGAYLAAGGDPDAA